MQEHRIRPRSVVGQRGRHAVVGLESFESTDQSGGEPRYLSDCIPDDVEPEPDAEEGLAAVRVIQGVLRAPAPGRTEELPSERGAASNPKQVQMLAMSKSKKLVDASEPIAEPMCHNVHVVTRLG